MNRDGKKMDMKQRYRDRESCREIIISGRRRGDNIYSFPPTLERRKRTCGSLGRGDREIDGTPIYLYLLVYLSIYLSYLSIDRSIYLIKFLLIHLIMDVSLSLPLPLNLSLLPSLFSRIFLSKSSLLYLSST